MKKLLYSLLCLLVVVGIVCAGGAGEVSEQAGLPNQGESQGVGDAAAGATGSDGSEEGGSSIPEASGAKRREPVADKKAASGADGGEQPAASRLGKDDTKQQDEALVDAGSKASAAKLDTRAIEQLLERVEELERHVRQNSQPQAERKREEGSIASADRAIVPSSKAVVKQELSVDTLEDENRSLLDIVSQRIFEYVTTHLTPPTDRECTFDYRVGKCSPKCKCTFQFKVGDYTLSRACRLNNNQTELAECNPHAVDESDDLLVVKLGRLIRRLGRLLDRVAPPTDRECDWSWRQMACSPSKLCHFYFVLGDYHIGRSCRLRVGGSGKGGAAKGRRQVAEGDEEDEEAEEEGDDPEDDFE